MRSPRPPAPTKPIRTPSEPGRRMSQKLRYFQNCQRLSVLPPPDRASPSRWRCGHFRFGPSEQPRRRTRLPASQPTQSGPQRETTRSRPSRPATAALIAHTIAPPCSLRCGCRRRDQNFLSESHWRRWPYRPGRRWRLTRSTNQAGTLCRWARSFARHGTPCWTRRPPPASQQTTNRQDRRRRQSRHCCNGRLCRPSSGTSTPPSQCADAHPPALGKDLRTTPAPS